MDADELLEFQFHRWWPRFQQVAYPARFVTLDRAVVNWLVADGVTVDDRHAAIPKRPARDEYDTDSDDDWEDGPSGSSSHLNQGSQDGDGTGARAAGDAGCSSGSEGSAAAGAAAATETVKHCRFPELERQVERCLTELGGRVVAKLNWSCPTDAVWVTTRQRLVCHSADEILLMLKSSDRIAHDICNAFEDCSAPPSAPVDYVLGLRKAFDLKPEREFRCFVHGHRLVGASQRDVTQFFPQLAGLGDSIKQSILDFHAQHVSDAFPVPDYVMDLYVASNGRVRLLDFNPIAPTTHPLLFDWQELPYARMRQPAAEDDVDNDAGREAEATAPEGSEWEVRLIEEPGALRPGAAMAFGLPLELSGAMGGLDELIDRLRRDCTANPPEDDVP